MKEIGKMRDELKDKGMVRWGRSVSATILHTTGWSVQETGGHSGISAVYPPMCVVVCRWC